MKDAENETPLASRRKMPGEELMQNDTCNTANKVSKLELTAPIKNCKQPRIIYLRQHCSNHPKNSSMLALCYLSINWNYLFYCCNISDTKSQRHKPNWQEKRRKWGQVFTWLRSSIRVFRTTWLKIELYLTRCYTTIYEFLWKSIALYFSVLLDINVFLDQFILLVICFG